MRLLRDVFDLFPKAREAGLSADEVSASRILPLNFHAPMCTESAFKPAAHSAMRPSASAALSRTTSATLARDMYSQVPSMRSPSLSINPARGVSGPRTRSLPAFARISEPRRMLRNSIARLSLAGLSSGSGTD